MVLFFPPHVMYFKDFLSVHLNLSSVQWGNIVQETQSIIGFTIRILASEKKKMTVQCQNKNAMRIYSIFFYFIMPSVE